MALFRLPSSGPAALMPRGNGLLLRAPQMTDFPQWAQLRESSRAYLTPWEPIWPSDDLTRAGFRRRLRRYAEDIAADRSYDAAAILGLAVAQAGRAESAPIRDAIRKVVDPRGTVIHAGAAEFRKAFALIKEGKPVRYVGVIGPVGFDRYGDITGPFRLWRIKDGQVATVGEMSAADIDQLKAKLGD